MADGKCPGLLFYGLQPAIPCDQPPGHIGTHGCDTLVGRISWSGPEVHWDEERAALFVRGRSDGGTE